MHCRGCDCEIDVKWIKPDGAEEPLLEDLCSKCLAWAEVARAPGPLKPPSMKRRVVERPFYASEEETY